MAYTAVARTPVSGDPTYYVDPTTHSNGVSVYGTNTDVLVTSNMITGVTTKVATSGINTNLTTTGNF